MSISWKLDVGVNHTPAYQVSGAPFATGSVDASSVTKVEFPYVTRWIYILNNGDSDVQVGFSEAGVTGDNFFTIPATLTEPGNSMRLELKVIYQVKKLP